MVSLTTGFSGGSDSKEFSCNAEDLGLIPQLGRSPGVGQPTPVCLPGEFHGQSSLAGHSQWGHRKSDTAEQLSLTLLTTVTMLCITPPGHFITGNLYLVIPFTHSQLPYLKAKTKKHIYLFGCTES